MTPHKDAPGRARLNRGRVLETAVALADEIGIDALSMRRLAQELDVVPMALYKHVADKEGLLDGMVETIIRDIDPPASGADWKSAIRQRVLSARSALKRHPWARQAIESRTSPTPAVLKYQDAIAGIFLSGGFSADLAHHVMHVLGGRMWGFTQELFEGAPDSKSELQRPQQPSPEEQAAMFAQMMEHYPNIVTVATATPHDKDSVVGRGCDDQFEFEFALDLLLDGFEQRRLQGWTSLQR